MELRNDNQSFSVAVRYEALVKLEHNFARGIVTVNHLNKPSAFALLGVVTLFKKDVFLSDRTGRAPISLSLSPPPHAITYLCMGGSIYHISV